MRHRRRGWAVTGGLLLIAAGADPALGVVRVGLGGGSLAVVVDAGSDANAVHGVIVEPFTDVARNGFRVRQDALGVATITSSDGDCLVNGLANDVVCSGTRGSLSVTMRGGADRVTLRGANPNVPVCFVGGVTVPAIAASASLGAGDDLFAIEASPPCAPGSGDASQLDWSANVDGEDGLDRLRGGSRADTLLGGEDGDDLQGNGGDDLLRGGDGRDDLDGGPGNDTLRGGDGLDALNGSTGDDLMHAGLDGAGPDVFVGGAGTDTATYVLKSSGVTVTVFDPTNPNVNGPDGTAGENDAVQQDVENVTGSTSGDVIRGNNLANRLDGLAGADTLTGAAGADSFAGGEGDDVIDARDGARDASIDCGPGTADRAILDLVDPARITGCESVSTFATDDGPPGRILTGVLRIRAGGTALARISCPATARVRCRGALVLRRSRPGGRVLGRAAYSVPTGATVAVGIAVPPALRGTTAQLRTTEKGVSRKGPRSFSRVVRVR